MRQAKDIEREFQRYRTERFLLIATAGVGMMAAQSGDVSWLLAGVCAAPLALSMLCLAVFSIARAREEQRAKERAARAKAEYEALDPVVRKQLDAVDEERRLIERAHGAFLAGPVNEQTVALLERSVDNALVCDERKAAREEQFKLNALANVRTERERDHLRQAAKRAQTDERLREVAARVEEYRRRTADGSLGTRGEWR